MENDGPRYVNFVQAEIGDDEIMYSAELADADREYFLRGIIPTLRPLSDDDYQNGPVVILKTMARFSYILFRLEVYWCVEWPPGLLVIRFSPNGSMGWSALRSPVPHFGGREPVSADLDGYDDAADNPQYNLVFCSWDAQFDADDRRSNAFEPASGTVAEAFDAAVAHAQTLGALVEAKNGAAEAAARRYWSGVCFQNLTRWAGDGIRVEC